MFEAARHTNNHDSIIPRIKRVFFLPRHMKGADMMIAVVESFATAATIKYIASMVT